MTENPDSFWRTIDQVLRHVKSQISSPTDKDIRHRHLIVVELSQKGTRFLLTNVTDRTVSRTISAGDTLEELAELYLHRVNPPPRPTEKVNILGLNKLRILKCAWYLAIPGLCDTPSDQEMTRKAEEDGWNLTRFLDRMIDMDFSGDSVDSTIYDTHALLPLAFQVDAHRQLTQLSDPERQMTTELIVSFHQGKGRNFHFHTDPTVQCLICQKTQTEMLPECGECVGWWRWGPHLQFPLCNCCTVSVECLTYGWAYLNVSSN